MGTLRHLAVSALSLMLMPACTHHNDVDLPGYIDGGAYRNGDGWWLDDVGTQPTVVSDAGGGPHGAMDAGGPPGTTGAGGPHGAMDAGGGPGGPGLPSCGDPQVMARFQSCHLALTSEACHEAGGTWVPAGNPLPTLPFCQCGTGQIDCSCTRDAECLSGCSAPLSTAPGPSACTGVTLGKCREEWPPWPWPVGCDCMASADGIFRVVCLQ
jgi:hypothetical protein